MTPSRIILAFLIILGCYAQADDYSVTNSLEALNIPKIDLKNTPFPNVISQLNEALAKNKLPEITVDLTLPKISVSTNASAFASAANAHVSQFLQEFSSQTNTPPPITFSAQRISMLETLRIVAAVSGLDLFFSDKTIIMRPGPHQLECEAFRVWYVGPNQVLWIETTVSQPWAQTIVPHTHVALLIDSPERLQQLRESQEFKELFSEEGHNK